MRKGLMDGVESLTAEDVQRMKPARVWSEGEEEIQRIFEDGARAASRQLLEDFENELDVTCARHLNADRSLKDI